MDTRAGQAITRALVSAVLAAIASVIGNITFLNDVITDPILAATVITVAVAVLQGIAKYLGGVTEAPASGGVRGASPSRASSPPGILAI